MRNLPHHRDALETACNREACLDTLKSSGGPSIATHCMFFRRLAPLLPGQMSAASGGANAPAGNQHGGPAHLQPAQRPLGRRVRHALLIYSPYIMSTLSAGAFESRTILTKHPVLAVVCRRDANIQLACKLKAHRQMGCQVDGGPNRAAAPPDSTARAAAADDLCGDG